MRRGWTDTVRREVLPNGLTILVQSDPESPAVAVVTHVRAGFFDEPDHWAGISHVLEHMFFKGTPSRGPGAIARETKAVGGYLNAGTGYDHTSYYTVLPAASLETALEIQSDALRHAAIDAGELQRELQVIIEEARRKRDTPGAVAHETMHAVLFDRHRIRRWRIGDEARLAAFTREDVAGYYRSRYVPSRTIVAVVGGREEGEMLRLVRARYADWPASQATLDPPIEEPWHHEVRARTLRGDVTQASLVLGWRAVPVLDADRAALEMAAAILSNGRASWLQRNLRQAGLVNAVSAGLLVTEEVGVFSVSAELAPDWIPEVMARIAGSLARLAAVGPAADDLERSRTMLKARWARWLESVDARAAGLAHAEATDGFQWLDRAYAEFMAVDADQVRAAVGRWLGGEAVTGVAYLPHGVGEDLTPARLRDAFRGSGPPVRPSVRRVGATHTTSVPGLDIVVRRKAGAPLVTLRLHRRRSAPEPPPSAGVGLLAVRSAVRGAGGLDAGTLAAAFERLGGAVSGTATADAFGYGTTVLAEHLPRALDLLRDVLWHPTLAESTIGVERDTLQREARRVTDDMVRYPFQLALAAAFGDAGYGVPTGGTEASLASLDAAAVRRWLDAELATGPGGLFVVGDVDPEETAAQLAERFLDLGVGEAQPVWPGSSVQGDTADSERLVERERQQTAIATVFPGPSRRDPARHAAEVWAAVAGGLGGRLFEALRDRRSLAYTVIANAWQRLGAGALLTYIATSPEREAEAREQMQVELDRFRREGVTPEEFQRAVAYLAGQAEVGRQTGADVAAELLDGWLAGDPLDDFEDPGAMYRAVTLEAVHAVLETALDPARRVEGVVRGRSSPPA